MSRTFHNIVLFTLGSAARLVLVIAGLLIFIIGVYGLLNWDSVADSSSSPSLGLALLICLIFIGPAILMVGLWYHKLR